MSNSLGFVLSADTSNLLAKMVEAGMVTEREAKKMQRSLDFVSTELKKLSGDAKAANEVAGMGAKQQAATNAQLQDMRRLRAEANLTANAMRQLPAQFTDVFTQLAGGQNIGLILIQQGGQIRDSFGGVIPALRGVLAMLTPVNLGIAALTAGLGGAVYAFFEGRDQADKLTKSLILTGNAAGLTADGFGRMAESAARASNGTIGAARAAGQLAVSSGIFGAGNIGKATEAIVRYERLSGETADKVMSDFAGMANGVAKWAAEHNQKLGFITGAQYAAIKAAEEMGDKQAAIGKTLDALNEHLQQNASWWEKVKQEASKAWDAMLNAGRPDTVGSEIARIANALAVARADAARFRENGGGLLQSLLGDNAERRVAELEALLARLQQSKALADQVAAATARSREQQAKGIAAQQKIDGLLDSLKTAQNLNKELKLAQQLFADAAAGGRAYTKAEQDAYLAEIRKRYTPEFSPYKSLMADLEKYEKQTQALAYGIKDEGEVEAWAAEQRKKVAEAAAKMTAAEKSLTLARIEADAAQRIGILQEQKRLKYITDGISAFMDLKEAEASAVRAVVQSSGTIVEDYRRQAAMLGLTSDEAERLNLELKLQENYRKALAALPDGADQSQVIAAQAANAERARDSLESFLAARRAFNADPRNGIKPALQAYYDDATNGAKKMEGAITGSLQRAEDAFINFVKTGKLSVTDLFAYIAEQYIRARFQEAMAGAITAGGGASNFSLGTLFSAASSWFGGASHASGLEYVPYNGYPAVLHEGERVQTKMEAQAWRGGAGGSNVDASLSVGSVGAGVSRAEMNAALQQFGQQQMARIRRLQQQGLMA
ncbi:MAG TPA: phage tail length tape measure family protein [Burkholderiaceae bacterium]|nr:phage tail length tape measure family protein [Burkholderiaceae bacterium]